MSESSGTPSYVLTTTTKKRLRTKTRRRLVLATLIVIGGAVSLAAQAQQSGSTAGSAQSTQGDQNTQSANAAQPAQTNQKTQKAQKEPTAKSPLIAQNAQGANQSAAADQNAGADQAAGADQSAGADQAAGADQGQQLQEVVVTGSLIARPAAETAEAITTVTTDSLKAMGISTVEQALAQIATNQSTVTTQSSVSSWAYGGGSFANLRGLGDSHTLVLLDGQRLANSVVTGDAVDLNGIPLAAIDHIEVLREGASSLYGSDAIAGVINFITKKNYENGEVDLEGTEPQDPGGAGGDASITWGKGSVASDGYNFMFAGNYSKTDELTASQRSFASTGFNPSLGLENQNGPMGTWPGSYLDDYTVGGVAMPNTWQVGYPACTGNPHLTEYFGNCAYLYSAAVDLIPPSDQISGLASFTKTLAGNNQLSLQYLYSRFEVTTWGGPQTYSFVMDPSSPYYPTAAESTCYGTCTTASPVLGGPITAGWTDPNNNRYEGDVNTEQRVLLSLTGSNGGWDYTGAFDYSVNHNVLDVSGGYANYAVLAPGGVLSPLINPFGAQSAAGQALINSAYLNGDLATGSLQLYSLNGNATHPLGDAFGAGRPATLGIGFDTEYQGINFASTGLAQTLYTATYYPPEAISGHRNTQAVYTELNVPITREFEITASDREDRYSDFGDTNNGKISFRYQPFHILTFRGAASTGFRAPSLVQLYLPQIFGADAGTMDGPGCASGVYTTVFTYSNCTAQGMSLTGGNRTLKPETSENFDFGFIVEPISNLGVTVDYYRVVLKDEIQQIPDSVIYGNPTEFANYYVLNSAGTLTQAPEANTACPTYTASTCGYIIQTYQNTGGISTNGLDLSADYTVHTRVGQFRVDLEGTLVTQYLLQAYTNGPEINLDGWLNQGFQPVIKWSHTFTLDWASPMGVWGAGIENRFLSDYTDQYASEAGQPLHVANYSLWNPYVSWKPINALTVMFGIRNVLNTNPPFSNQIENWQAGYNPVFSDPTGRAFYLRLKYQFL